MMVENDMMRDGGWREEGLRSCAPSRLSTSSLVYLLSPATKTPASRGAGATAEMPGAWPPPPPAGGGEKEATGPAAGREASHQKAAGAGGSPPPPVPAEVGGV